MLQRVYLQDAQSGVWKPLEDRMVELRVSAITEFRTNSLTSQIREVKFIEYNCQGLCN